MQIDYSFFNRFPVVRQSEISECGHACVAMVASSFGHKISLLELRQKYPTSSRGITMSEVQDLALKVGLSSVGVKYELSELQFIKLPAIVHWGFNHFVVLVKVHGDKITIADPASGLRTVSIKDADTQLTGVALQLSPAKEFEKREHQISIRLRDLVGGIRGYLGAGSNIVLLAAMIELLGLLSPLFSQIMTDSLLVTKNENLLTLVFLGFLSALVLKTFLGGAKDWALSILSLSARAQIKERVLQHLFRLPAEFFDRRNASDTFQRFEALNQVEKTVTSTLLQVVTDSAMAVVVLFVVFAYSKSVGFAVLGTLLLYAAVRVISFRLQKETQAKVVQVGTALSRHVLETMRAMVPLKVSSKLGWRLAQWNALLADSTNAQLTQTQQELIIRVVNGILLGGSTLAVSYLAGSAVLKGDISLGEMIAVTGYAGIASSRLMALIDAHASLKLLDVHLERLTDIVYTGADSLDELSTSPRPDHVKPMSIEFRNVYFRYSESSPWILENCSFTVEKGEHVCLAGRSGAGKTTVLKLILGILTPTSGEILVDGKSLADYGMHTLRKSTGVVLQNDKLYSGSIVDNVSYFDEAVSVDRVTECLEHASVLSDVRKLTMGLYSLCDEDSTSLSSGQVQRLIIARALYANPVLLLMDEATSHLDVGTEQEVTTALKALDCTRIFIAHRPEAIATAHRVMKMQQGRLVEDSTYKMASDFAPLF